MNEILYCTKCHWQGTEVDGRQYSDGSIDQWCPSCEKSDDHITSFTETELIALAKKAGWRWNGNAYVTEDSCVCRSWQDLPIEELLTPVCEYCKGPIIEQANNTHCKAALETGKWPCPSHPDWQTENLSPS